MRNLIEKAERNKKLQAMIRNMNLQNNISQRDFISLKALHDFGTPV